MEMMPEITIHVMNAPLTIFEYITAGNKNSGKGWKKALNQLRFVSLPRYTFKCCLKVYSFSSTILFWEEDLLLESVEIISICLISPLSLVGAW